MWGMDELVERYKEISKFLIVDAYEAPEFPRSMYSDSRSMYDERGVEIFRERIQTYKDLRLKEAIKEGMKRYDIWRKRRKPEDANDSYDDNEYEVLSLIGVPNREFTPELEWGIFCKKLNEYGLYTYFGHEDKSYHSYYRSNNTFSAKDILRT
jgi:hypothetical protein